MWKYQGPRIEFTGMIKKKSCGISMSLGYWILSFQWHVVIAMMRRMIYIYMYIYIYIYIYIILPRWLFPSKIYIQFIIFNTYFSTKLSFTKKDISPARASEVCVFARRCQVNYICSAVSSSSFSLFTWQWNKLCCHVLYDPIGKIL